MDEVLEAAELVAESELEGAVVWLLRIVGVVAVLAGLWLWLFTEAGLFVLPAALLLVGAALIALPGVAFERLA